MFFIVLFFLIFNNFAYTQVKEQKEEEAPLLEQAVEEKAPDPKMKKFRDIIITSSYGAFAGAITGLAILAFVSRPQDKLNYITIGASIGLYAGTLLGLYFAFGVGLPKQELDPYEREFEGFGINYNLHKNSVVFNNFEHNNISLDTNTNNFKIAMPILIYNF